MPDIDRTALNEELLHRLSLHPKITMAQADVLRLDYCTNLNAIVDALNALGLRWWYTGAGGWVIPSLSDGSYSINGQQPFTVSDRATPAALATALVRAALKVLGEEENDA